MHLTEKRIPATKKMLDDEMARNPAFADFMTIPIVKLPPRYVYLIAALPSKADPRLTLYDIALECLERYTANEFSIVGRKITGFMSYIADFLIPHRVLGIVMFSCDVSRNNNVLLHDMLNLIKELQRKYASVEWDAAKDNPANRIYQRLAQKEDGRFGDNMERPGLIRYRLPGTMSLPEKMHFSREYGVWYRDKKGLYEYLKKRQRGEEW